MKPPKKLYKIQIHYNNKAIGHWRDFTNGKIAFYESEEEAGEIMKAWELNSVDWRIVEV